MPVLVPDQRVEKWRIVRPIASGGFGAVYEAIRDDIGQRGALKVLTLNAGDAMIQRFINEARAANAIRHTNIPSAIDFGRFEDGTPWMVQDFLDGVSLEDRLSARQRLTLEETLALAADMASALEAAHRKGIIHRDLKPSNLMLVPEPTSMSGERTMVLDFGICKLHTEELTKTGAILGTPVYMALEQVEDASNVTGQADVYSMGVILYKCLTGRLPFTWDPKQGHWALMLAKESPPTPITKYTPTAPAELQALIMKMLARKPTQRPSMADVEIMVRRQQGLPPPRQTGAYDALAPRLAPLETGDEPTASGNLLGGSTGDISSGMLEPISPGPTPSEQKIRGELSPPMAVPISVSDVSTNRVPVPLLQVGPDVSTVKPAPTLGVPVALATPTAPTAPEQPPAVVALPSAPAPSRRRGWSMIGAAILLAGLIIVVIWSRRQPAQQGPVLAGHEQRAPLPAVSPPPLAPVVDVAQEPAPVERTPPAEHPRPGRVKAEPKTTTASHDSSGTEKATSKRAKCGYPIPRCITALGITQAQREAVIKAFTEAEIKLCNGQSVLLHFHKGQPKFEATPAWLPREEQDDLILNLKTWAASANLVGVVAISCDGH